MKLRLLWLPLALACAAGAALAQANDDDDFQTWNELELALPLSDRIELSLLGELRLDRNLRDVSDSRVGAGFSFKLSRDLSFSPEYLYVSDYSPRGRTAYSHRLRLNGTVKVPLGRFAIINRKPGGAEAAALP